MNKALVDQLLGKLQNATAAMDAAVAKRPQVPAELVAALTNLGDAVIAVQGDLGKLPNVPPTPAGKAALQTAKEQANTIVKGMNNQPPPDAIDPRDQGTRLGFLRKGIGELVKKLQQLKDELPAAGGKRRKTHRGKSKRSRRRYTRRR